MQLWYLVGQLNMFHLYRTNGYTEIFNWYLDGQTNTMLTIFLTYMYTVM